MEPKINREEPRLKLVKNDSEIACYHCGSKRYQKNGTTGRRKKYHCKDCKRYFLEGVNKSKSKSHYNIPLSDDVWSAEDLGLRISPHRSDSKLIFLSIQQGWLKEAAKKFIHYKAATLQFQTLQKIISSFNTFSEFIALNYPQITWKQLNRDIILDYINYLTSKHLNWDTKNHKISHLKELFEIGKINHWFEISSYLISPEDYLKPCKRLPRYIPEVVMTQLNKNLQLLPEPITRMVLMIQETGLRIGELLQMSIDCLKQDSQGNWLIYYMNWKMSKEDTKPISRELAKVIQEQQKYIKEHLGKEFSYLYCARKGGSNCRNNSFIPQAKVMSDKSFLTFLRKLAKQCNIVDDSGKLWNFQAHQFRHTVGTRMINAGVPHHIIQRYLGHESPAMTSVYAHIHDSTLRKEIEKYHESKVVNFQGQTVELDKTILSSNDDLEWFKKNIQARALEHGYCARPKVLGDCDIPGFDGCYNCPHWRTNSNFLPILKDTLDRTNKVIEKARNCGWELQVKKNEPIQQNLETVIKSLEEEANEQKD